MEQGHARNVANFETAVIALTAKGAEYAPPQDMIKLPELQTHLTEIKAAVADVDTKQAARTIAKDEVQAEFKDARQYAVNIKRMAEVMLNDAALTSDLQTIVNKFMPPGRDTGVPDDPLTPDVDESKTPFSQSQLSRDNQIAYLADISALLKNREDYDPPDAEYKTTGIDAKIASMTAKNNNSKTADVAFDNSLETRDALLYENDDCTLNRVKLIKTYVAVKFGKDSALYQQINALEFKRY